MSALIRATNIGLDIFGCSPVRHKKVDHPLGLDKQIAAEEEDAEDHGEWEHAHDSDLDHSCDEEVPLGQRSCLKASVRDHWGRVAALEKAIATVGK